MKMMKDRQLGDPFSCKAPPDAPMWAVCSVRQENGRSVFFFGSSSTQLIPTAGHQVVPPSPSLPLPLMPMTALLVMVDQALAPPLVFVRIMAGQYFSLAILKTQLIPTAGHQVVPPSLSLPLPPMPMTNNLCLLMTIVLVALMMRVSVTLHHAASSIFYVFFAVLFRKKSFALLLYIHNTFYVYVANVHTRWLNGV